MIEAKVRQDKGSPLLSYHQHLEKDDESLWEKLQHVTNFVYLLRKILRGRV